jgi:hypothetical protein
MPPIGNRGGGRPATAEGPSSSVSRTGGEGADIAIVKFLQNKDGR